MPEQPPDRLSPKDQQAKDQFLYPKSVPTGDVSFQEIVFDANLQDFSQRVSLVCALETNGKISATEAYAQIKELWQSLHNSKENILDYQSDDASDP